MGLPYEILEHPADVGFRAWGTTLEELFVNAARAMASLACAPEGIEERESRDLRAEGTDTEALLYAWLAEILAIADAEQFVFRRFEVTQLRGSEVRGRGWGEPFDRERHAAGTYIKAVTLHQFRVKRTAEGFEAQVFLDL